MPRFAVPAGFTLPEGTLDGEEFQVVVTAKIEDGQMEISEVEGIAIEGYEDEDMPETEAPEEEEMAEEETAVEGETAGDRFNRNFRGRVTGY